MSKSQCSFVQKDRTMDIYKKDNHLLILGNGFDLDIGYRTKYSDFARSNFWPFSEHTDGLGGYLQSRATTDNWLDLEMALLNYASYRNGAAKAGAGGRYPIDSDKSDYQTLVLFLQWYIKRIINEREVKPESVAAQVLRTVLGNKRCKIYSFNYTNLRKIAYALYIKDSIYDRQNYNLEYVPIHGCAESKEIILGVNSDAQLLAGYDFLRKNEQPSFCSTDLRQDLMYSKEITFFGLSMGSIDYPYFREFWESLSNNTIHTKDKKHITIFTYNNSSRFEIINSIKAIEREDLLNIQSNAYVDIICTHECSSQSNDKIRDWTNRNK